MRLEDPNWTDVKKTRAMNKLVPAERLCQAIEQTRDLVGTVLISTP
jgi:hypothetical protein